MADVEPCAEQELYISLFSMIAGALIQKPVKSFGCHLVVHPDLWGQIALLLPHISLSPAPPFFLLSAQNSTFL